MSFGLSLPIAGATPGFAGTQSVAEKQNTQKPTFEVIEPVGGPVDATKKSSIAPVTQAAAMEAENRSNQNNTSQQFGLAALALESILKNVGGQGGTGGLEALDTKQAEKIATQGLAALTPQKPSFMNGAESVKGKEIELKGLKALTPEEPSFKKGLDSVRSMNNPAGDAGESRLV